MNDQSKGSAPLWALGVLILALIGIGAYFMGGKETIEDLIERRGGLADNLAAARQRETQENRKLDEMTKEMASSSPSFAAAYDSFVRMDRAVRQTDAFFDDPNSSSPRFRFSDSPSTRESFGSRRGAVNKILNDWRKRFALAWMVPPDQAMLDDLKRDSGVIQSYLETLAAFTDGLTAENSSLSQFEINAFRSAVTEASIEFEGSVAVILSIQAPPAGTPDGTEGGQAGTVSASEAAEQHDRASQATSDRARLEAELARLESEVAAAGGGSGGQTAATGTPDTTGVTDTQGGTTVRTIRNRRGNDLPDLSADPSIPRPIPDTD